MKTGTYQPPLKAFEEHALTCPKCEGDVYGFCALGYRLLGEAARMRNDDPQLPLLPPELTEKPATRIFLGHKHGPKFFGRSPARPK